MQKMLNIDFETPLSKDPTDARWHQRLASLHNRRRACGTEQELLAWCGARHLKRIGNRLTG